MTIKKKAGRGGKREGAGRKPKWPTGTELKTMRLPACLEKEIFQYAQKRIGELGGWQRFVNFTPISPSNLL